MPRPVKRPPSTPPAQTVSSSIQYNAHQVRPAAIRHGEGLGHHLETVAGATCDTQERASIRSISKGSNHDENGRKLLADDVIRSRRLFVAERRCMRRGRGAPDIREECRLRVPAPEPKPDFETRSTRNSMENHNNKV